MGVLFPSFDSSEVKQDETGSHLNRGHIGHHMPPHAQVLSGAHVNAIVFWGAESP